MPFDFNLWSFLAGLIAGWVVLPAFQAAIVRRKAA